MRWLIPILACTAFAEQEKRVRSGRSIQSLQQVSLDFSSIPGKLSPLKALVIVCFAFNPASAFNPSTAGVPHRKARGSGNEIEQAPTSDLMEAQHQLSRRRALKVAAAAAAGCLAVEAMPGTAETLEDLDLVWQPRSAAIKRVAKTSYAPTFITYLARFLLNYDRDSAGWWVDQGSGFPVSISRADLRSIRERQFGQFSESVELGLARYQGKSGIRNLFSLMRSRYGSSARGKIQLALLFSLISPPNQPADLIQKALGEADRGSIESVSLTVQGSGYSDKPPQVSISKPDAGQLNALAHAEVQPTGRLASVQLVSGGSGYTSSPAVTISPPVEGGRAAQAVAQVQSGCVTSVELTDPGSGYSELDSDTIQVFIEAPLDENSEASVVAEAFAVIDRCVSRIVLDSKGSGYGRDQPVVVNISTPQESGGQADGLGATGEVSVFVENGYGMASGVGPYTDAYPYRSVSAELLKLLPDALRPLRKANGFFAFPTAAAYSILLIKPSPAARAAASFGPLGASPVQREVPLRSTDYLRFAISGAVCTSLVRSALVPLDVSKTLMQSDPKKYPALREAISSLWEEGGLISIYRSIDVTAVTGLLLGGFGFGCNEFLRRYFASLAGPQAQTLYSLQISISAALGSVLITCIATCPFEVLRIRAIESEGRAAGTLAKQEHDKDVRAKLWRRLPFLGPTSSDRIASHPTRGDGASTGHGSRNSILELTGGPYSAIRGLGTLWDEGGLSLWYSALPALLLRELPFSIAKFLVYDWTTQAITTAVPSIQEGPLQSALLSCISGLAAGVVGAAVSTPADTLLTLTQAAADGSDVTSKEAEPPSLSTAFADQLREDPLGLFRGLVPRCVFFGALVAGQFVLYDSLKSVFKVGSNDLTYVLDVFTDRLSFYEGRL